MGEVIRRAAHGNIPFYVLSFFAVGLLVLSFVIPPLGVIDGSVLAAVGEIFGFSALWTLVKAIDMGATAKVTHNDTTVEIGSDE